jgi:hypothetical protein
LAKQICTGSYDQEIKELRTVAFTLNELEKKGDQSVKDQVTLTLKSIDDLINVLKNQVPEAKK